MRQTLVNFSIKQTPKVSLYGHAVGWIRLVLPTFVTPLYKDFFYLLLKVTERRKGVCSDA